ncbi:MAG TPA: hypothetical protein VN249_05365 [Prolixibacteraceae bacterium]|nr:hypothetical protein [Prolixibacteraceae bacterium]
MEHHALSQITPTEILILSEITPQEAKALLSLMQAHIPAPQKFNPNRTWEESCYVDRRFEKVRAILSCRAEKEVAK